MGLQEHLEELRSRLIKVLGILGVSFLVCYSFGGEISELLLTPLRHALKGQSGGEIVYLGLLDKVISQLQIAFWSALIFSSPLWFWQVWSFIRPGLYEREIKAIRPFILVGLFLFWAGVLFGHLIVFPLTFETLLGLGVENVHAKISLKQYLVLSSKVLVFLGLIFQLPNILLILGLMGLVTKYSLRKMRRYLYVVFAVASAIMTPPDIVTMLGLWLPLVILFEFGILAVALIVHPFLKKQTQLQTK